MVLLMERVQLIDPTPGRERKMHCIAATKDICGEGAVWHPEEAAIYWTDINRRLLHRYQLSNSDVATWQFDQPVTAVVLTEDPEQLLIVLGGGVIFWNTKSYRSSAPIFQLPSWPVTRCKNRKP